MKRHLFVLLAALTVFVFQAISWVVLPFHAATFTEARDPEVVASLLREQMPTDGIYSIPGMQGDQTVMAERYKRGPVAFIHLRTGGTEMMEPGMFLRGILIDILVAALIAILLRMTSLPRYLPRIIFVSLIGLAMGLFTNLNNWNWMAQPGHYTVVDLLDTWIAWTLAAPFLARSA